MKKIHRKIIRLQASSISKSSKKIVNLFKVGDWKNENFKEDKSWPYGPLLRYNNSAFIPARDKFLSTKDCKKAEFVRHMVRQKGHLIPTHPDAALKSWATTFDNKIAIYKFVSGNEFQLYK